MAITQKTSTSDINAYLNHQIDVINKQVLMIMQYVGETGVNIARTSGSYHDRTGNLRSSVGYLVIDGGIVTSRNIVAKSPIATESVDAFINELTAKYNKGIVLILLAGMDYASKVSAMNYDVLDSAEVRTEPMLMRMLKNMGIRV